MLVVTTGPKVLSYILQVTYKEDIENGLPHSTLLLEALGDMFPRRLDGAHKAHRIGDGRCGDGVHAGAFDSHRPITQQTAQQALGHLDALDIGQSDLIGAHRQRAVFFHKAMAGDADLGGPFADHHAEESDQPQDQPDRHQRSGPSERTVCGDGNWLCRRKKDECWTSKFASIVTIKSINKTDAIV